MAESLQARLALRQAAEEGRLAWSQGVHAIRNALGLTQAQFASAFGLTVRQVSQLETGAANPTIGTLQRIAGPLGLTVGLIPAAPVSDSGRPAKS
jgi:transcriptional regulator with XRE-family HTH domain